MIDLNSEYLQKIKEILFIHVPECEVRAFGSRLNDKCSKYSDLDLVLVGNENIEWRRLEDLRDALAESDLPIMVDILDWNAISGKFRKIIENNYIVIQRAHTTL
jgi:predicted nucleotidyltransferase